MEKSPELELTPSSKYKIWGFLLGLILIHLSAYLPEFTIPHPDLLTVMHVINNIWNPEFYGGDWLSNFLMSFHPKTAPIYYYGLTYPLRFLLSAKWTILFLGFTMTIISAYFAGYPWKQWKHVFVAVFVVIVILNVNVSPLEGNKRSFTAVFLLILLGSGGYLRYPGMLFLTAFAAGVYPPAGLIVIAYYAIARLDRVLRKTELFRRAVSKVSGLCVAFLLALTPYLLSFLQHSGDSYVQGFVDRSHYSLSSLGGLLKTFILGSRGTHYGALFMRQEHLVLFLIVLVLCLVQYVLLRDDFTFGKPPLYLILASLGLWIAAHLFSPLLYFPFKYTRLSLALALAFPAMRNISGTVQKLRQKLRNRRIVRWLIYGSGVPALILYGLFKFGYLRSGLFQFTSILGANGWEFLLTVPVATSVIVIFPDRQNRTGLRGFLVVLLVGGLVFLPHTAKPHTYQRIPVSGLKGMYETLKTYPPGTRVAGPPPLMDTVPAFGLRTAFNAPDWRVNDVMCQRNQEYWSAIFAEDPSEIRTFMTRNNLQLMIVDRLYLKKGDYVATRGCLKTIKDEIDTSTPYYLNREFDDVPWRAGGRFLLISPDMLSES